MYYAYTLSLAHFFSLFKERLFIIQHQNSSTLISEERFEFATATIKVLALNQNKEKAIVYFGGNAEAVERTAPELNDLFPECAVYLVKYRGYGGSTGKP